MPALKLFGSIHIDRRSKVRRELASFSEGADALFVEYPEEGYDARTYLRLFVRAPLLSLGIFLASLLQMPLYALFNRSRLPAEVLAARRIAEERGLPVIRVDEHFRGVVDAVGPVRRATEWVVLAGALALEPYAIGAFAGTILLGIAAVNLARRVHRALWLPAALVALAGLAAASLLERHSTLSTELFALLLVLAFGYQLRATLDRRNEHMLRRIAGECEANGYERACLTTGYAHVFGLGANAPSHGLGVAATYRPRWLREGRIVDGRIGGSVATDPDAPTFGPRVAALLIDWVALLPVLAAGVFLAAVAAVAAFDAVGASTDVFSGWRLFALYALGAFLADLCYWTLLEGWYGKTPGKRLLGLVVVDDEGAAPGVRTALVRNLLRPVDALGFYLVGAVATFLSDRRGRIGDIVANTRVVAVADPEESS